jgi:hypothetical protein
MKHIWKLIIGSRVMGVTNPHTTTLKFILQNNDNMQCKLFVAFGAWVVHKDKQILFDGEDDARLQKLQELVGSNLTNFILRMTQWQDQSEPICRITLVFDSGHKLTVRPHDKDIADKYAQFLKEEDLADELIQVVTNEEIAIFKSDGLQILKKRMRKP